MSKNHFIALADMIRNARAQDPESWKRGEILSLADFLGRQNSNFNEALWLDYINGKCGPSGGKIK